MGSDSDFTSAFLFSFFIISSSFFYKSILKWRRFRHKKTPLLCLKEMGLESSRSIKKSPLLEGVLESYKFKWMVEKRLKFVKEICKWDI
jgi:hypothetical protein